MSEECRGKKNIKSSCKDKRNIVGVRKRNKVNNNTVRRNEGIQKAHIGTNI